MKIKIITIFLILSLAINFIYLGNFVLQNIAQNVYKTAYNEISRQLIEKIEKDKKLEITTSDKIYNLILQDQSR